MNRASQYSSDFVTLRLNFRSRIEGRELHLLGKDQLFFEEHLGDLLPFLMPWRSACVHGHVATIHWNDCAGDPG